jgi:hypothetical protein
MAGRNSFVRSFNAHEHSHRHHHNHNHQDHHHHRQPWNGTKRARRASFGSSGKSRASRRRDQQKSKCDWDPCSKKDEKHWRVDTIEHHLDMQRMRQNKYCANCQKCGDHCTELCNVHSPDDHCFVCGGTHQPNVCDQVRCSVCSLSHHKRNCQVAPSRLYCTICKRSGHLDLLCSSNWRMFASTTEPDEQRFSSSMITIVSSPVSTRSFCSNCASDKHFYSDCPQLGVSPPYGCRNDHPSTVNVDERNQLFESNLELVRSLQPFVDANARKRRSSLSFCPAAKKSR